MLKAKPLLKDKFWIIEDEGLKIGTLCKDYDGYLMVKSGEPKYFNNKKQIINTYGDNFFSKTSTDNSISINTAPAACEVYGYPTRVAPVEPTYDVNRKLPLFKKSKLAKSVFCAGYYAVCFNSNWLKSFCPKLITIENNPYIGPFRSKAQLTRALEDMYGTTKHETD